MKKIKKMETPAFLEKFKADFRRVHGREAIYEDLIHTQEYKQLKERLIEEQCSICCYCMKRIRFDNAHIEHLNPQSLAMELSLEYSNMLASCNGMKEQHENCGHRKGEWYHPYQMVSPLSDQCETTFHYGFNGEISSDQIAGKETISHLELDSPLLNRARRSAIYTSGIFDDDFEERKDDLIEEFSVPYEGMLPPFCMAVVYCMKACG